MFLFQSIYSVPEELEDEADRVFEKYAHNQCKNMMYQARPDAVKYYYREIIKSPKTDAFASSKLLTFEEYMQCKPDWFTDECWESLCKYWCSAEYLKKRKLGQDSRKKNPDGAQNRGGSRPLVETQQFLVIYFITSNFFLNDFDYLLGINIDHSHLNIARKYNQHLNLSVPVLFTST